MPEDTSLLAPAEIRWRLRKAQELPASSLSSLVDGLKRVFDSGPRTMGNKWETVARYCVIREIEDHEWCLDHTRRQIRDRLDRLRNILNEKSSPRSFPSG